MSMNKALSARERKKLQRFLVDYVPSMFGETSYGGLTSLAVAHGFFTAYHCCPVVLQMDDWLPLVFDSQPYTEPRWRDQEQVEEIMPLLMRFMNQVGRELMDWEKSYKIPFETINKDNGTTLTLYAGWALGFMQLVNAYPALWGEYEPFWTVIEEYTDVWESHPDYHQTKEHKWDVEEMRVKVLAMHIETRKAALEDMKKQMHKEETPAVPDFLSTVRERIGRNEPCLCGSGKKYKRCCGVN